MSDILTTIIERRLSDIEKLGLEFGCKIPKERSRKVHPFLNEKGLILEVKRASPSKGDIAPNLDSYQTALAYSESGARAISCLTEKNFFKGSLEDLMNVCKAVDDFEKAENDFPKKSPAVLRKDFLLSKEEIEVSFRAGADAVLLIARILTKETFLEMAEEVVRLGLTGLIEVRTDDDLEKLAFVMAHVDKNHFVCGVNSRDLSTFKIDLLRPVMMKEKIVKIMGSDARIIFESGVTTAECAASVGSLGFAGILLGEAAAKNPCMAKEFVHAFENSKKTENASFWLEYAESSWANRAKKTRLKICGFTRSEDAEFSESLGADFLGFVFSDGFARSVTRENRLENLLPILSNLKAKKVAVITETESSEAKKAIEFVKDGIFDVIQLHKIQYEKVNAEILNLPHYFATDNFDEYEKLASKGEMRVLLDLHGKSSENAFTERSKKNIVCEVKWLAGGITPQNAKEILERFKAELIDVSGGVENEGLVGIKDESKLRELCLACLA
ncbi:bifunctional indole-3-glycerol phosphate synthase/phosphoribosylanthranilate isomerase [Treponema zioleckii]|uniref:bifunctional indole-3-glycerol phosphate synthase/phosphoribosylanthranilate isomerase n=1 Tax=Treponema zioleckii TaxID=331680 RepID=UPI001F5B9D63|nr:bifunctional indole-3-glycerol phosphate synthase/phosphoribosylanthranilate isomerase [Treponema zioleckii]